MPLYNDMVHERLKYIEVWAVLTYIRLFFFFNLIQKSKELR